MMERHGGKGCHNKWGLFFEQKELLTIRNNYYIRMIGDKEVIENL